LIVFSNIINIQMIDYINYKIMKKEIFKDFFHYKKINFNFKNIKYDDIDMYVLIMI